MMPALQLSLGLVQGQLHLTVVFSISSSDERDLVSIDFHTPGRELECLSASIVPEGGDDRCCCRPMMVLPQKTLNFPHFPSHYSILTLMVGVFAALCLGYRQKRNCALAKVARSHTYCWIYIAICLELCEV